MSASRTRSLALALAASTVGLIAAAVALDVASGKGFDPVSYLFIGGIGVTYAAVGVLIATRRPGNAIAWVFLVAAVGAGLAELSSAYADLWLSERSGPATLGKVAAAYGDISWVPFILVPVTFLLLLFPDGHLLTRRWRPVAWSAGAGIALDLATGLVKFGPISDYPSIRNPLGIDSGPIDGLEGLGALLTLIGVAGSVAALILRFRRAHGLEREQLKWLAYAGAVAAACLMIGLLAYDLSEAAANGLIMSGVMGLPIATGVAIARYRLYDIDVVINRTLVYGVLTATLASTYLASVLLLQIVLEGVTQGSGFAVAVSTLAAAGLFRPARSRIQAAVDHRFYRRKYDAQLTLEHFGARLRDELDLAALNAELRWVVADTMQPAHVSLWLRQPEARA